MEILSTTSFPTEVIKVKWSIENFHLLYKMSTQNKESNTEDATPVANKEFAALKFNVGGDDSEIRSEWKFYLTLSTGHDVGLFLSLMKGSTPEAEYKVSYIVYLNDNNGDNKVSFGKGDVDNYKKCRATWGFSKFKTIDDLITKYIKDDGFLHLTFEMKILGTTSTVTQYKLDRNRHKDENEIFDGHHVFKGIEGAFKTGLLSDVTFFIKNSEDETTEVKAHKLMLSIQSPVFEAMFNIEMKETITNVVHINDVSPVAFNLMIQSLYTGHLPKEWETMADELIYLSDKYQLIELKDFLDKNINFAITLDNALQLLQTVKLFKMTKAEETIKQYTRKHWEHYLDKMISLLSMK